MVRRPHILLVVTLTVACRGETAPSAPAPRPSLQAPEVTRATIVQEADLRRVGDSIRRGLAHRDPVIRRTAAIALARQHSLDAVPLLRRTLRDPDPTVRRAASLGLSALEHRAPDAAVSALTGALAAEMEPETRTVMIRDLGRMGTDRALAAATPALWATHPAERAAACLAAAERGLDARAVPPEVTSRIPALIAPSEPSAVRLACSIALARLPVPTDPAHVQGALVALEIATGDADPEVRAYAYRALGRYEDADLQVVVHGTQDEDWRVAVNAFRALSQLAPSREDGPERFAHALRNTYDRATRDEAVASGPALHILLAALEAAGPLSATTPIYDLASSLHESLGRLPAGQEANRDRALAHCAAAELADRGRGWPSRVRDCGLDRLERWERLVREAQVLGALEGAVQQRLSRLRQLLAAERPALVIAAVRAAAAIVHADATTLVLETLHAEDPGIRAAAAAALRTVARREPQSDVVPPPLPVEPSIAALRAARDLTSEDELETLTEWIAAVDAIDARDLAHEVRALALHPSAAVRIAARELLDRWQVDLPEDEVPPPPNPLDPSDVPSARPRPRVRLDTDRGRLVIELRPDLAPTTVARFLSLVERGFYNGLIFHRVVPGFVVQGGDPRGDGYGGPGFWQRCEDNRLPYRRGTVGMALAGRDTGGSQFFITQSAQPHLEGRYTGFGVVIEGLEHLDQIQVGDRIQRALVSR